MIDQRDNGSDLRRLMIGQERAAGEKLELRNHRARERGLSLMAAEGAVVARRFGR